MKNKKIINKNMLLYYHTNVSAETMYKNYTKGEIYIMSKINKR